MNTTKLFCLALSLLTFALPISVKADTPGAPGKTNTDTAKPEVALTPAQIAILDLAATQGIEALLQATEQMAKGMNAAQAAALAKRLAVIITSKPDLLTATVAVINNCQPGSSGQVLAAVAAQRPDLVAELNRLTAAFNTGPGRRRLVRIILRKILADLISVSSIPS